MTRVDFLAGAVAAAVLIFVGILVGRMSQDPATPAGSVNRPLTAESNRAPSGIVESPNRSASDETDHPSVATDRMPARGTEHLVRVPEAAQGIDVNAPSVANGELEIGMRSQPGDAGREVLRLAATRYLSRTESFLTRWRAGDPASTSGEWTRDWARRGLSDVRLLLDTTGSNDPELKSLLLDLEVVLAQILQASADESTVDRDLATRRLNDRAVLPRLRNMIPAGPEAAATQGVPR